MAFKILKPVFEVAQTGPVQRGSVIFLHGSGDTGKNVWNWINQLVPDFPFHHLKIIFPTAPLRPYSASGGEVSNVWFDRLEVNRASPEQLLSIDEMAEQIIEIIKKEESAGIPINRVVIGGFSMGGAMALHLALRHVPQVAGVFALSSFVNDDSALLKLSEGRKPPLFQWHGARDNLVPISWGNESFRALQDIGINGEFHVGQNALHELKRESLAKLKTWILARVPNVKQPKI